jgi:plasmid stabilization system protein ParE
MSDDRIHAIHWRKAATEDLAQIVDYVAADNPIATQELLDGILKRVESLARHPSIGGACPYYPKARQITFGNYIIYYSVSRREVLIRAIVHGARLFRASRLRRP